MAGCETPGIPIAPAVFAGAAISDIGKSKTPPALRAGSHWGEWGKVFPLEISNGNHYH